MASFLRMPGGSWDTEEDLPVSSALGPGIPLKNHDILPSRSTESRQGETEIHYEIVTVDSAKLEEIVILSSPVSTRRIRMEPEYDIEELEEQQEGRTHPIRDSPQQRRSRCLESVFPEIEDDLHSASCNVEDDGPLSAFANAEWDFWEFTQYNNPPGVHFMNNPGESKRADIPETPTSPQEPTTQLGPELCSPAPMRRLGGESTGETDVAGSPIRMPPPPSPAPSIPADEISRMNAASSDISTTTTPAAAAGIRRSSLLPSPSSLFSSCSDEGALSSGLRSPDNSSTPACAPDDEDLQPLSLSVGVFPIRGEQPDGESLLSGILDPTPESLASFDDEPDHKDDDSMGELEYIDEDPLSLSSLILDDITIQPSLDNQDLHLGPHSEWDLVRMLPSHLFGADGDRIPTAAPASAAESIQAEAAAHTPPDDEMEEEMTADAAPALDVPHLPDSPIDSGEYSASSSTSSGPETTPELPALHFHSRSLTDELSAEFHAIVFPGPYYNTVAARTSTPIVKHARTASAPNPYIERKSIVWVPGESRYTPDFVRVGTAKRARPRPRTTSGDSGLAEVGAEPRRVEREVQTEGETDDPRATLRRLKRELKNAQVSAKAAKQRATQAEQEMKLYAWAQLLPDLNDFML